MRSLTLVCIVTLAIMGGGVLAAPSAHADGWRVGVSAGYGYAGYPYPAYPAYTPCCGPAYAYPAYPVYYPVYPVYYRPAVGIGFGLGFGWGGHHHHHHHHHR